jgi:hypothetical protein
MRIIQCSTLPETDRRTLHDRRKKPTPMLSWHTFLGQRRGFRRESDREKGGYTDRYSLRLFFLFISILCLNIVDVFLTNTIVNRKGWKLNPMIRSVMEINGERFWIWKFAIISVALIFLCLHINFKPVKTIIVVLSSIYFLIILYQIFLLVFL